MRSACFLLLLSGVASACTRPSPVPVDLDAGVIDAGPDIYVDAGPMVVGPPAAWLAGPCLEAAFDGEDGCDCGCGAPDPDCAPDPSSPHAEQCTTSSCIDGGVPEEEEPWLCRQTECGDGLVEGEETCEPSLFIAAPCTDCVCSDCKWAVPAAWSCGTQHYGSQNGCDCGCGAVDPDCVTADAGSCEYLTGCQPAEATGPEDLTEVPGSSDPTACVPNLCGDGFVVGSEACDDGAVQEGDGCGPACAVEDGFACVARTVEAPRLASVCVEVDCGDGVITAGFELCDDGNEISGDGCSTTCVPELAGSCAGHCGEANPQPQCYCLPSCLEFGDCCADYYDVGCFDAPEPPGVVRADP